MIVEPGAITAYLDGVSTVMQALLPLLAATMGVYLAFGILDRLKFTIVKMVKSR